MFLEDVCHPHALDISDLEPSISAVIDSGRYSNRGDILRGLENRLSSYFGVGQLVLGASGSAMQMAALIAMRDEFDYIVSTPFTFVSTISIPAILDMDITLVDVDCRGLLRLDLVEEILASRRGERALVMPVGVFGQRLWDSECLKNLSTEFDCCFLIDLSHSFPVDSGEFTELFSNSANNASAFMSMHATKLFSCGEGGAFLSSNIALIDSVREVINFGILGDGRVHGLGLNGKMSEFNACLGSANFSKLPENIRARRNIAAYYYSGFRKSRICFVQPFLDESVYAETNCSYMPMLAKTEVLREEICDRLQQHGIGVRRYFYPSLSTLPQLGISQLTNCDNSERISRRIFCIPMHSQLDQDDVDKVLDVLASLELYDK